MTPTLPSKLKTLLRNPDFRVMTPYYTYSASLSDGWKLRRSQEDVILTRDVSSLRNLKWSRGTCPAKGEAVRCGVAWTVESFLSDPDSFPLAAVWRPSAWFFHFLGGDMISLRATRILVLHSCRPSWSKPVGWTCSPSRHPLSSQESCPYGYFIYNKSS